MIKYINSFQTILFQDKNHPISLRQFSSLLQNYLRHIPLKWHPERSISKQFCSAQRQYLYGHNPALPKLFWPLHARHKSLHVTTYLIYHVYKVNQCLKFFSIFRCYFDKKKKPAPPPTLSLINVIFMLTEQLWLICTLLLDFWDIASHPQVKYELHSCFLP